MTPPPREAFEREQGFSDSDWQRCLPGAVGAHPLALPAPGRAVVTMAQGGGRLDLQWTALPPRRIALLSLPRLAVRYRFEGVDAAARREFMRYFDLFTQRGGG
ncbi:MAG: hypothetical protein C0505_03885 [Leptothrix sp. (in: Bacteria)]|nr:hypothetical protein [Leptothrix sp. (in: b-proteobacteria)]